MNFLICIKNILFYSIPLVRNQTGWNPPKSNDTALEDTIQLLKKYPLENNCHVKHNLSRNFHKEKILSLLNDPIYYEETDKEANLRTKHVLHDIIRKYGDGLIKEECDYLTNFEHTSYFYGLPKIHKSKNNC
jgi:hypothetical protein